MRNIWYIVLFMMILFGNSAMAWAQDCSIWWSDNRAATDFLNRCANGTVSLDPGMSPPTMPWVKEIVILIANGVISFGALLAVWALVWSGIQYTKAYGDEGKLKKAKLTGIYSVTWLILLLISFGSVDIFINFIYTITGN